MRLAAVQGLESMATPEAAGALGTATQLRGKKVRQAAADALAWIRRRERRNDREAHGRNGP